MRRMPRVRAVVKAGPGQVECRQVDLGDPAPGEALVRTTLTTVCGSDLHFIDDFAFIPEGRPQGHEAVGVIDAVGEGVERLRVGDRVVVSPLIGCGHCLVCEAGDSSMCVTYSAPLNCLFGCQAEAFKLRSADFNLARIPDGLSDRSALFAGDIMSTGFAAIERGHLARGQSVAIFAQGPIGLCATAAAIHYGAGAVFAVESISERCALAKRLGAHEVFAPEVAVERIRELTAGRGVDLAVEAVGKPEALAAAQRVIRPGGTISSVGVYAGAREYRFPIDAVSCHFTFTTTMCPGGHERLAYLMQLLERGAVDLSALWTHDRSLSEAAEVYDMIRTRRQGAIKVALTP